MPAMTVTATQGGSTGPGFALRVFVLTQAAATQNGNSAGANGAQNVAFTTSVTGSRVYGAAVVSPNGTYSVVNASTTQVDNIADATNGEQYLTFKTTSLTGTPGAITGGVGYGGATFGGVAAYEVLAAGTLTEDGSAPAPVNTTGAGPLVTASFTPPDGALLVALIASDGGGAQTTFTVAGGGLTWTPKKEQNVAGADYAGVWIAQVPAGGGATPVPVVSPGAAAVRASSW